MLVRLAEPPVPELLEQGVVSTAVKELAGHSIATQVFGKLVLLSGKS